MILDLDIWSRGNSVRLKGFGLCLAILIIIVSVTSSAVARSSEFLKLGFSSSVPSDTWRSVEFSDKTPTRYHFYSDTGAVCARAESSASGLARKFPEGRSEWTQLSWEWKINGRVEDGNARRKTGDDYAARVYVNYQSNDRLSYWESLVLSSYETIYGRDIPRRSINFIWANILETNTVVPSPYTSRVKLIALRNRTDPEGTWVEESVNLETYYNRLYEGEYVAPDSLAIMTDTDNTNDSVTACYRNVRLSK